MALTNSKTIASGIRKGSYVDSGKLCEIFIQLEVRKSFGIDTYFPQVLKV